MVDLNNIPKVELHRHLELSIRHSTMKELAPTVGISIPDEESFHHHFLITEPMSDLETVLSKFLNTQKLLFSAEILKRITYEIIEDAHKEGIRILELRYAPTFIKEKHDHFTFDKIHQAIDEGVKMAEKDFPIAVGLLCTIQRTLPLESAQFVGDFCHRP